MKTQNLLPYLIKGNWLLRYANLTDLQQILKQMDHRFAMKSNMNEAVDDLYANYEDFQREFHLFFKDLMVHAETERIRIGEELRK